MIFILEILQETNSGVPAKLTSRKSKEKCDEYAIINSKIPTIPVPETAIIAGSRAWHGDYPHTAALGYEDNSTFHWQCGGTLISDRYIITAAHCLVHIQYGPVKIVRMGDNVLEGESKTREDFGVKRTIRHPDYNPPATYNDIGNI